MASMEKVSLRERTRRAVQGELVEAAQNLFLERGYDATTVDDIAAAAGLSRRSFFRYFTSKEELVLGKFEMSGEELAEAFRARPASEDDWTSIQRMFDGVVEYVADEEKARRLELLEQIVASTPSLRAAYLGRLDAIQGSIVEAMRERAEGAGRAFRDDDPTPEALVGAAFACIAAARAKAATSDRPFSELAAVALGSLRQPSRPHRRDDS